MYIYIYIKRERERERDMYIEYGIDVVGASARKRVYYY